MPHPRHHREKLPRCLSQGFSSDYVMKAPVEGVHIDRKEPCYEISVHGVSGSGRLVEEDP